MPRPSTKETYKDRNGIPFASYHTWLPAQIRHWPTPARPTKDNDCLQSDFHSEHKECWWCGKATWRYVGRPPVLELHHLCAGYSRGRTMERELFVMACQDCHRDHVGEADFGRWLWLKWRHDPCWCDWVRLALRHGSFLPELITE